MKVEMLFTSDLQTDLILVSLTIVTVVAIYFKRSFTYWKRRGLHTPPPSFPFGTSSDLFLGKISFAEAFRSFYSYFKSKGLKHGGLYGFTKPYYMPVDLDIIKCVLQSNFQNFFGHGLYTNEEIDPLSSNLFALEGTKWKNIRQKYTPIFTIGKMKMMFSTLLECSNSLKEVLGDLHEQGAAVNIKDVAVRFTTDVICTVGFGIESNSLKNPETDLRKYGNMISNPGVKETIRQFLQFLIPHTVMRLFKMKTNDPRVIHYFTNMIENNVNYRETNNIIRRDFLHLLLQLKNKGEVAKNDDVGDINQIITRKEGTITLNEIIGQCFIFYVGGFETSSITTHYAAYELAANPDVQEEVRKEINFVLKRYDNKLTYEAVMEMNYLDKVICETLRKYPPAPQLFRVCNEDFKVPDSDIVIEKGTNVMISTLGIHYDPEYYPDPEKFDPERFSEQNKAKRHHFSWLPFGEGPRVCIGMRFAKLQVKVGLITLLRNYDISLNQRTQLPFTYKKTGVFLTTESGIWLDIKKRENGLCC